MYTIQGKKAEVGMIKIPRRGGGGVKNWQGGATRARNAPRLNSRRKWEMKKGRRERSIILSFLTF